MLRINPEDFSNDFFIHARHTCNGCSTTPIIGTRYHSKKVPDVDICSSCFTEYEGDKLDFMPEIHGMLSLYIFLVDLFDSNLFARIIIIC